MSKSTFLVAFVVMLMAGTFFTSCQSSAEKVDNAEAKVEDAQDNLTEVQKDATEQAKEDASEEEWRVFRADADARIKDNDMRIAELRQKMKTSGKTMDAVYSASIDALEQRNRDMKDRIENYQEANSNWTSFKREFDYDMEKIGESLKGLVVDNK